MAPENLLVGIVALALLPLIAGRILRGLKEQRLPLYRSYVRRSDGAAKFTLLLALHAVSFLVVAAVAADLLLDLGLRSRL